MHTSLRQNQINKQNLTEQQNNNLPLYLFGLFCHYFPCSCVCIFTVCLCVFAPLLWTGLVWGNLSNCCFNFDQSWDVWFVYVSNVLFLNLYVGTHLNRNISLDFHDVQSKTLPLFNFLLLDKVNTVLIWNCRFASLKAIATVSSGSDWCLPTVD